MTPLETLHEKMMQKLKEELKKIWKKQIRENYKTLISERHLQAEIYKHLSISLRIIDKDFSILVEPRLFIKVGRSNKTTIPDLVVIFREQIIGVIELKFTPNSYAAWESDFKKLISFAKEVPKLNLKSTKALVKDSLEGTENLEIPNHCLCCFAVITKDNSMALKDDIWKKFPTENRLHLKGRVKEKITTFITV
jgi:hypothetical protein